MRTAWVVATLCFWICLLGGTDARAQNVKAHRASAERALVKERFCEAVYLYEALDKIDPNPDHLLAAAEAADRADDRTKAAALYKAAIERKHPRVKYIEQQLAGLQKRGGSATSCSAPRAECGNGLLEAGETCDDGNSLDGDKCPRTCTGAAAASPAPVPAPVALPAPIVVPVPVPPVVVPPVPAPVPAPAPVPVPKAEPKAEPSPAPESTTTSAAPSDRELCTLIKEVRWFQAGKWDSLPFGTTLAIKGRGPQWAVVDGPDGEGKIKIDAIEGACAKEAPAAPAVAAMPAVAEPPSAEPTPTPAETEPAADSGVASSPEPAPLESELPGQEAPEVKEGGGSGIGGWLLLGAGVAVMGGGVATAVFGVMPVFDAQRLLLEQDGLADDYGNESNADDLADIAYDTRRAKTKLDNATQRYNDQGRFMLIGGSAAAVVGLGLVGGGLIWALTAGGDEGEGE
jgi:cysteine-rich repeat protein